MKKQIASSHYKSANNAGELSPSQPALLSRRQVADMLGVCETTVYRMTRKGLLPALVIGKRLIRYTPEVVNALLADARIQ
jgi:excisionase family DNA binding protein